MLNLILNAYVYFLLPYIFFKVAAIVVMGDALKKIKSAIMYKTAQMARTNTIALIVTVLMISGILILKNYYTYLILIYMLTLLTK